MANFRMGFSAPYYGQIQRKENVQKMDFYERRRYHIF